jgi:TonB-linked SusC/RagA family outer membrane protein
MMRIRFDSRLAAAAVATLLAATASRAQAQDAVITGRVTGEQGRPLAGATVLIPQLSAGTNTNESGTYTITIAASRVSGQTVVMTARMVGHAPARRTITISAGTQTVDLALVHQPVQLNEVVVTGTAEAVEQRKVGFAVGVVNAEQLKEVPATSAAGALAGKVAGAQVLQSAGDPGAAPAIKLRSATSLTGTQEPLIIIDGTITRASLADINSEDIERMEVIKGAAASSLYGSDAANGVIQIWTKRGASLPEDKVAMTFRSEYGQSELPKRIPQTRSHYFQLDGNGDFVRDEDGARVEEDDLIADNPYPVYYDHQDDALRNGASYSTYLSLGQRRGGTNYNASWQRTRQEGILFGLKGYDRNNFRLNVDQQVNDRFDVSLGGFYARSSNNNTATGAGSPFFALMFLEPHLDLKGDNADGTKYNVQPQDILWSSNATNVLYTLANTDQNTARNRYTGTFRGRYRILDWLVGEANYNFDGENEEFSILTPKGFLSRTLTPNPGALQQWNVNGRTVNMGATLTSTRNLTSRIVNTTKASVTYEGQKKDTFNILANNFAVVRTPEFGAITGGSTPYSSSQTIKNRNAYLITGFDIADRYIVDALVRRDESSLFGENERSHTYYRASGSYIVSEDFPMPNVDLLKLRLSRGTAGLRPTFDAQYESYTLNAAGAFQPATLGNPDLKPATSTETEAGFNLDFLQRYSFEYTFSNKVTEDQILLVPLSAAAGGFRYQWQNAGTLEGKTHEMAFRALLLDRQDLSWRLNITGDRTRQKISQLSVAPFLVGPGYGLGSSEDNNKVTRVFKIQEGETFGVIYGTRTVRDIDALYDDPAKAALSGVGQAWSRDSVMINEEGYVVRRNDWRTDAERPIAYVDGDGNTNVKIGDVNPDFNLAFNTNVTWKGFNVSALVNWVQGGNVYNGTRQWPFFELRDRAFDQAGKPEAEKKPVAYYQFFYNGINPIDYFVEDGSYIKLKELAVNYTIPRTFLGRMRMGALENARIGIVGRNLWTKTDYSGFDPEVAGLAGDPYSFRFDGFSYPNFRTFTGMIELGF